MTTTGPRVVALRDFKSDLEAARSAVAAEPATSGLRFLTPAEMRTQTPEAPQWVLEGYIARGWLTLLGGKPKIGKSTTIAAVIEAVAAGAPSFLGRAVSPGRVIFITEEGATTALAKLPDLDGIRVLTRDGAWPKPSWPDLIAAAVAEAKRIDAAMIVLDSYAFWAALPPDAEKDTGWTMVALSPLLEAAASGLAIVLVHHQRKAAGEGGDALRGSTAITATADMILEVERLGDDQPARFRRLVAVGRWPETPGVVVVDFDPHERSWRVVGEGDGREDSSTIAWREKILNALPTIEPGATYDDLTAVLPGQKRDWLKTLNGLVTEGLVNVVGRGVRGDPKRYSRGPANSVRSFRSDVGTETTAATPMDDSVIPFSPVGGTESESASDGIPFRSDHGGTGTQSPERTVADLTDSELLAIFPGSEIERMAS